MIAREWSLDDIDGAWDMYRRPEVMRYIGGVSQETREDARVQLDFLIERNAGWPSGYGSFPLFQRSDDRLIGTAIFKILNDEKEEPTSDTEIGWHVHPDSWGRGLAPPPHHLTFRARIASSVNLNLERLCHIIIGNWHGSWACACDPPFHHFAM